MNPSPQRPVVFFAFANDRNDGARYLRNLPQELRAVRERLEAADFAGLCELVIRPNTTLPEILNVFQDPRYRQRIAVFHFGGHAGGWGLILESAAGAPVTAHADGLAEFLGQQHGLQLVFLNGCSTEPQVEGLLAAGVQAVIATATSVDDGVATHLAERFYAGLASGAAVAHAWAEAVGAVRTLRGDAPRDVMGPAAEALPERWPWNLHVRDGAEIVRDWSLPKAAGNPLWGLPTLPEGDLSETPYRHLEWFREVDAEVFFGRSREIRDLYDHVVAPTGAPILLFCGQSGVGKSSLLAAGLIPYLRDTHEVIFARREREVGLAGMLRATLGAEAERSLNAAWRDHEARTQRPLVIILDQVEEAYTRPGPACEVEAFVAALVETFGPTSARPRGRLVLGFRKEWLADLEEVLRGAGLPRSKFFLDRLGRAGVTEVVEGPTRSERLRRHYRLTVEPGLPGIMADDLLADLTAPVAPTLAVLLTKMWRQATTVNEAAPTFDGRLYNAHRITLLEFLDEQLAALRGRDADVVESGLALDVVAFHTTPLGTAEQRSWSDLETEYSHRHAVLPELIRHATELYLLTGYKGPSVEGTKDTAGTRLVHDTLAPLVRMRFDDSDRPGQRARRILESRATDWQSGGSGAALDEADLTTVEAGASGMRVWDQTERRLIDASRTRATKARTTRRALLAAGLAAVVFIAMLAVVALDRARAANEREAESTSRALAAAANGEAQTEIALLLAVEAVRLRATYEAKSALLSILQRPSPRVVRTLTGHTSEVWSVAFSPDGRQLVSGGIDRTVRLWDVVTRQPVGAPLAGHTSEVSSVAFRPDGRQLVSGGGQDKTVRLWDVATRQPVGAPLTGHTGSVHSVTFSPDSRQLVSGDADGTLRLWDVATRQPVGAPLTGHTGGVLSVAFSPDGRRLVSGGRDGTVRLWDVALRQPIGAPLPGHWGSVLSVAFSPDGRQLVSGGEDGTVRLWDVATRQPVGAPLTGHRGWVGSVAFSPDGRQLVSGDADGTLRLWDVATRQPVGAPLPGHRGSVRSVAFSADGQQLVSGGEDRTVRLWDVVTRQLVSAPLTGHTDGVESVAFSPDGRQLVSGGQDKTVRLWDAATRQRIGAPLTGHTDWVLSVVFSAKGGQLVSGGEDRTIRLWDVATRQPVGAPLTGHTGGVLSVAFSPDDRRLVSGGRDGTVRLWDVALRQPIGAPLPGHRGFVHSVAFSPDGRQLVSGGFDETVRLWDVALRQPIGAPLPGHSSGVRSVAFSPDGRLLVSGGQDGTVRFWDVATRQPVGASLTGHRGWVGSVAFSPDGRQLVSGGFDETLRLWDVVTRQLVGAPLTGSRVASVAFSPDGRQLVSGGEDGTVRLWDLDLESHACAMAGRNLPLAVWQRLLPGRPYDLTCDKLPPGEGAPLPSGTR